MSFVKVENQTKASMSQKQMIAKYGTRVFKLMQALKKCHREEFIIMLTDLFDEGPTGLYHACVELLEWAVVNKPNANERFDAFWAVTHVNGHLKNH